VPDHGGQREDPLEDADGHPLAGAPAVAFRVQLAFERLVDRFDDLAQRLEQRRCGRIGFAFAAGRSSTAPVCASWVWKLAPK
jgi:hypothetical protein